MISGSVRFRLSKQCVAAARLVLLVLLAGVPAVAWGQAEPKPKATAARDESRATDREAIAAMLASFAKAFQTRDAEALAGHWTEQGEYDNDSGLALQGRDTLAKGFAKFFERTPEVTAELRAESLKFLGRDTVQGEGVVLVRKGPASPTTRARFSALLVREDGKWRLARLSESSDNQLSIAELGWLIGEWRATKADGAEIHTTYAWSANKKFIQVEFSLKENELALAGKQVIGLHPADGQFHTWTFEADGGVGEAVWQRDGDHWTLEVSGTLADGRQLVETNILRKINDDTLTWQSVNRRLDDVVIPDLPPVKVTRVKSKK